MKNNEQLEPLRFLTEAAVKYDLCYFRVTGKRFAMDFQQEIGGFWEENIEKAWKTAYNLFEDYYDIEVEQVYFLNGEPVRGRKQWELTEKCLVKF